MTWTSEESTGRVAGLAAAVTFGASAPLTAALAGGSSPVLVAGLLYAGAALVLVPVAVVRIRRRGARLPVGRDRLTLLALTLLGGIAGPVLLVTGLERLSSSVASLLLNLEAVATVLVGAVVFREHVGGRAWRALALVVAGGAVLVGAPSGGVDPIGAACILGACCCWGVDNNLSRTLVLEDTVVVAGAKALGAATPMLVLGVVLGGSGGVAVPAGTGLLAVGAVGYGASISWDLVALRHLGAAREAVLFATAPFVGAVVGLALGQPLGWAGAAAGGLMAAGIATLLREDHSHEHRHEPMLHEHWHTHDDGHHDHDHPPGLEVQTGRGGRHRHLHQHREVVHTHPHVPDSHHRHTHPAPN